MYAHVFTYRLSSEAEVSDELAHYVETGGEFGLSDQSARTIASWYHSPSPRDRNITALSHGLPFDTEGLRTEVERDLPDAPVELSAMLSWIDTLEMILSE